MGAAILNDKDIYLELKNIHANLGGQASPFDCFLALRGIKTLGLRVKKSAQNAAKLVEILKKHPKVTDVIYPGLPEHPGHEL